MTEPGAFKKRTAETLLGMARENERKKPPVKPRPQQRIRTPLLVKNNSGEEIPAYGCMRVTGAEKDSGGRFRVLVSKPDGNGGPFLFNNYREIAIDGGGSAQLDPVVRAIFSTGTPAPGETWGPNDDWALVKYGQPAVLVYGPLENTSTTKVLVGNTAHRQLLRIGKAAGDISADTTGTISIYSDGLDTTFDDSAKLDWMNSGEDITSGDETMHAYFEDEGIYRIIGKEC